MGGIRQVLEVAQRCQIRTHLAGIRDIEANGRRSQKLYLQDAGSQIPDNEMATRPHRI